MIAIGRRFLDPAFYPIKWNANCRGVRFSHQREQITLRVSRIERDSLERLEKFPLRKIFVNVLAPLRFAAEQDPRKGFFGQVIELLAATSAAVLFQNGREVGRFLRQNQKLRMIVQQRRYQRRSRFRLTGDKTRALIERNHYFAARDFRNHSTNRGSPSSNFVFGS